MAAAQMLNYFNGLHPGKPGTGLHWRAALAKENSANLHKAPRALPDPLGEAVSL